MARRILTPQEYLKSFSNEYIEFVKKLEYELVHKGKKPRRTKVVTIQQSLFEK